MGWQIRFNGTKRAISDGDFAEELKKDEYASRFEGGTVVSIDEFTPQELQTLAEAEGVSWYTIYTSPVANPDRYQRILEACATHAGVDAPEPAATVGEFTRRFNEWYELTQPDDEKVITEGFPQMPGQPEIGSTSGSPGSTDGPPTLSDDSLSENS